MREAFSLFDKDKDGRITCSELLTVMKDLRQQTSEDEIKDMITHADVDGSWRLSDVIIIIIITITSLT